MRSASVEPQVGHGREGDWVVMCPSCEPDATAQVSAATRDTRSVAIGAHRSLVIKTKWTLFDGLAGGDHAKIWLEPSGSGVTMLTQSWGPDVERWFGSDTLETWLSIGPTALGVLSYALVADHPDVDATGSPIELLAAIYRGDSAASAHIRQRLDALGLEYEFTMR